MPITEQQLRVALRTPGVDLGHVDPQAALAAGRRARHTRRARRARRATAVLTVPALAAVTAVALFRGPSQQPSYELVGSGLTLASGSSTARQVARDRVGLGGGLEAVRTGDRLFVVRRATAEGGEVKVAIDTDDLRSAGRKPMSYDRAALPGGASGRPGNDAVVGFIKGVADSVRASLAGRDVPVTLACFEQTPGWCIYAITGVDLPTKLMHVAGSNATVRMADLSQVRLEIG